MRRFFIVGFSCLLAVMTLPFTSLVVEAAVEAKCTTLGVNCICSAPMNTASFQNLFASNQYAPSDSLTKPCSSSDPPFTGGVIQGFVATKYWNSVSSTGDAQGAAITALPSGHLPGLIVQLTPSGTGNPTFGFSMFLGLNWNKTAPSAPTARRAVRMYYYTSSDLMVTSGGAQDCENGGKFFQLSETGGGIPSYTPGWNTHAWGTNGAIWSVPTGYDCCAPQPGQSPGSTTPFAVRGKWWYSEWVFRNLPGPQLRIEGYMRNVTDNGPVFTIMDSSVPTAGNGATQPWTSTLANNLSLQPAGWTQYYDFFRRTSMVGGGSNDPNRANCSGYVGWSHFIAAAWSTDQGQLIGPASEIEGGGAPPPVPPGTPGGVTVTQGPDGNFTVSQAPVTAGMSTIDRRVIVVLLLGLAGIVLRWGFRPRGTGR